MLSKLRSLALVSRPISWPNTAYPFAAAYLASGGSLNIFFLVGVVYFLIPYNLLMYGINDVFDYDSDMQNPRKGGMEGAKEQKSFHSTIIVAAVISNVPFLIYLLSQGAQAANLVLIAVIFFVVAYSVKGLRFKEIPLLDSLTSSLHFVGPMVYALVLTGWSPVYLPYVIAFLLWGIASHAFGAVQDILPDRKARISSVATVLGARDTTRIVFILYLLASFTLMIIGNEALIVGVTGLVYAANVWPHLQVTDKISYTTNTAWRRFIWLNLLTGFVITMVLILPNIL